MASSAKTPPSDHPPVPTPAPAPAPPQPAASGSQASLSSPPKSNPPIAAAQPSGNATATATTAPPRKVSGPKAATRASRKASRVTATAPSRNASGATTVAAPSRNPSRATTISAPSRKPSGATAPTAAAARNASGATSTNAGVPRNSSAPAVATTAVSRIPSIATVTVMSRNPLWCATTSTATAVAPGSGGPRTAPTHPEDYTPRMGLEFESEHEAYEFYRYYGWKVGFNIRKRYTNKSKKTGEITSCKFSCSREGYKANAKQGSHTLVPMPDSRTGCNAHLIIQRKKPGAKLEVYAFQPRHNHPLFVTSCMLNPFQRTTLPDVVQPPGFVVSGDEPEGKNCTEGSNAACAVEGHRRPLRTRRQWEMKYGEAGTLFNYFQEQSLADPLFYHAVQLDAEDKVANIFWADVRMINDYREFGDVVTFDVVSRNSISLRHFASFVGCNNFGESIVFGLALMYDETAGSFWWLFETFLHAMSGKMPKTFFSHQDAVIAKAVSSVMPDTSHAICAWHLKHTAARIVNQLVRGDCDFIKEFKACMNEYEEEMEFLTSWDAMITKYDLRDNTWLQKLFEDKEKWARPYVKGFFTAGMKGTRLNERLQSDVRDYLRAEVDIILFLKHLQKVINDRRYKELEVEYNSRLKLPYFKIRAPILIQASEAYTNMIFQLFQEEYEEFQSAYIVNRDASVPCREYVVSVIEKEKRYTVYGNSTEQTVSCSCRKFETDGFLCSHALKILDAMDIKYLPERYILKRWTKYARCLTSPDALCQTVEADKPMEFSSRYQHMCPKYARLVARASESEESYRVLDQCWVELGKKVEEILQRQTSIGTSGSQPDVQNLKISLSSIEKVTKSENVLDKSSSTIAKESKKKGQKSKTHPRNCIEKGLRKKQKVHLEQPAMQYALLDASAQSGNAMFQDLEAPHNMSPLVNQAPAFKAYRGIDLSSPMGPINFEQMHSGLNPTFTPSSPFQELGFASYHTCQPSSHSQHNQAR